MKDANKRPTQAKKFGPGLMLGTVIVALFVSSWEGGKSVDGSSVAYADKLARGLPTVCGGLTRYSTTTPIIVGERWPATKCIAEEQAALAQTQLAIEKCFKLRPPQSVFDAATSHAWNVGVPSTCGSSAMRAWGNGEWALGCRRLSFSDGGKPVWSYVRTGKLLSDGKPEFKFVQGLANRRKAETAMCLEGVPK